jgi:quercetin dioxygenase-like cupin family protein
MRTVRSKCLSVAVVAAWCVAAATTSPTATTFVLPSDLKWSGNARQHGLQTAPLFGNPHVAEPYAERIKIPAHSRLMPHRHPSAIRMVTVLSGTLYFAFGETFDETKLRTLPAGTFFVEPKGVAHYSMTKDEPVVLHLDAIGPAGTTYVDGGE